MTVVLPEGRAEDLESEFRNVNDSLQLIVFLRMRRDQNATKEEST